MSNLRNKYLYKEGLRSLKSHKTMTIASIGVLIACLLLTSMAVLFSLNISNALKEIKNDNKITVYLKDGLVTLESVAVGEKIAATENVSDCEFIDKDTALQSLMDRLGDDGTVYADLFGGFTGDDNFLPDSYKVGFKDLSLYKDTVAKIKQIEGVDSITDYSEVADKLMRIDKLVLYAGLGLTVLLSLVSLFIISNTIRVTMFSRRLEISIMKSVGATNGFIRFPFIVEGALIGGISALLSTLILAGLYTVVMNVVTELVPFFTLIPLSQIIIPSAIAFFVFGCLFGILGGSLSITRYLNREGGEIFAS